MFTIDEKIAKFAGGVTGRSEDSSSAVRQQDSSLDFALRQIVSSESTSIYRRTQELYGLLTEQGIDSPTAYKVCMLVSVPEFSDLTASNRKVMQSDVNRVIMSAQRVTKLDRLELLAIMHDVFVSIGVESKDGGSYEPRASGDTKEKESVGYVVPYSAYKSEMEQACQLIEENKAESTASRSDDIKKYLNPLVEADIPKAKYLMGCCMLNGWMGEYTQDEGRRLMEEAAAAGNSDALAELGDVFYAEGRSTNYGLRDQWSRAYDLYTGYGSLALTDERRENLRNILAHGSFNKRTMIWSTVLLACVIGTILWVGTFISYSAHAAWGISAIALSFALIAGAWIRYWKHPYSDNCSVPVGLFIVWSLYMSACFFC